jgi:hypothetical protein
MQVPGLLQIQKKSSSGTSYVYAQTDLYVKILVIFNM